VHDPLTRAYIEQLAKQPANLELATVARSIDRLDHDDAAARLLARGLCGFDIPAAHVARVYPRLSHPAIGTTLASIADATMGSELVSLVDRDEFPFDDIGWTKHALALYTAWRLDGEGIRPTLIDHARGDALLLRQQPVSREAWAILRVLADETQDPILDTHLPRFEGYLPLGVVGVRGNLALDRDARARITVTSLQPTAFSNHVAAMATTALRAGVPRNAPCWCGSGKKFKRCHGTDGAVGPGASTDAPRRRQIGALQSVDIMTMPLPELGELVQESCRELSNVALAAALERLLTYRAWEHVDEAFKEFDRRTSIDVADRDRARLTVFERARAGRHFERARSYVVGFRTAPLRTMAPILELSIALRERSPDAFSVLARVADAALHDSSGSLAQNIAPSLLLAAPALGLLFVRGALDVERPAETRRMLDLAEVARARLGLPMEDPAWQRFAALQGLDEARAETQSHRARADAAEDGVARLRREVQHERKQAKQQAERIQALEAEVARAEAARDTTSTVDVDLRSLRDRVEELQALLRERNDERANLRRQLAELERASGSPAEPRAPLDEARDDGEEDAADAEIRLRIPIWPRRAVDSVRELPPQVGREAVRTVGELSAGEAAAWRSVKRPKGMERTLLMSRIGIHHRLLFRITHEELEVVEVVTRASLLVTLKRLA
jgi:hypothetical protein